MSKKRQQIAAGNWKMNLTYKEGRDLAKKVRDGVGRTDVEVIMAAPFTHLKGVQTVVNGASNFKVAAQNVHHESKGAYTGEISVAMLQSIDIQCVIIGHSERREYFKEDDELLAKKVKAVLAGGLQPIFCCGEKLDIREAGKQEKVVGEQIKNALFHLSEEDFRKIVIAYEPVWAIGTGKTASPEQAQEMHAFIRGIIAKKYGNDTAEMTSILYGGSVKPANAKEIFAQADVDGGLVGGASLKADDFVAIVNSFA